MSAPLGFTPAARFLIVAGAFVVVVAGMKSASDLVTPFLLSVFIAVLASPPLQYLRSLGLPYWAAMLIIVAVLVAVGGGLGALFTSSLTTFNDNLANYQARLRTLSSELLRWLDGIGLPIPREALNSALDPSRALALAGELIKGLGSALTNALLILIAVVFMLLEASSLPSKLRAALRAPEESLAHLRAVMQTINRYMALKTSTSLLTGILVWIWLRLLGLDFPAMWGTLAFLLNFVPTIGSFIAAIPAVLLALVQLDLQAALLTALGFLVINVTIGNLVEPKVMGRGLGLSTLVVFVSLVFWGYVLGSAGMFLSVPLTMALKIVLDANPQTRPIAILLGPETEAASRAPRSEETRARAAPDAERTTGGAGASR